VHLSTGFLGTGYINPVLTASGHHDLAWLLATQSTYPSWGYMSKRGATTIWELWNSDTAGPGMNSRNHFCLGAVGEWFYESLAGIRAVDAGYQTFSVRPRPSGELTWVNCSLHSPYGQIVSNWKLADGDLTLDVTVPVNTSAVICVPTFGQDVQVSESGTPVAEAAGVTSQGMEDGCLVYGVGAGKYRFVAKSVGLPPAHRYPIPEPPPQIGELRDDFSTARIDEEKWQVLDMGLESSQPCGIEAKQEDGGLWVSGRTSVNYWSGKTLLSRGAFSVQPGGKLEVEVTRASLEAEGSGARSSLWMWVDASNYLMFSQDTEHGHWSYNLNGRKGPGEGLLDDEDGGSRVMALVHDGDSVHILLDGRELADVKVPWTDGIRVGLTGQARMEGDSVSVRFRGFRAEG